MDNKRRLELLTSAKEAVIAGIETLDFVALKDAKRGEFYTRITEYLRDAMKEPNGLDGYIADVEKEIEAEEQVKIASWEGVVIPTGYKAVADGETMWANDMVFLDGVWKPLSQAFKKKHRAMLGMPYPGDKFLLVRLMSRQSTVADPVIPFGYAQLGADEVVRRTDLVLDQSGQYSSMERMTAHTQEAVGKKFKDAALKSVVRRIPVNPQKTGVKEGPLPGHRYVQEGENILATDLVYVNDLKAWVAVTGANAVSKLGNLAGLAYLERFGTIIRLREEDDKTVTIQEPLEFPETDPRLLM